MNGIQVPKQFAIYANHQPKATANAELLWDSDCYLDGGIHGQSTRGQHKLQLLRPVGPGEEITADYGPHYSYQAHGFRRNGATNVSVAWANQSFDTTYGDSTPHVNHAQHQRGKRVRTRTEPDITTTFNIDEYSSMTRKCKSRGGS